MVRGRRWCSPPRAIPYLDADRGRAVGLCRLEARARARIDDSFLPCEQAALSVKAPGKSMKYYGRAGTKTAARSVKKHVKKPKFDAARDD